MAGGKGYYIGTKRWYQCTSKIKDLPWKTEIENEPFDLSKSSNFKSPVFFNTEIEGPWKILSQNLERLRFKNRKWGPKDGKSQYFRMITPENRKWKETYNSGVIFLPKKSGPPKCGPDTLRLSQNVWEYKNKIERFWKFYPLYKIYTPTLWSIATWKREGSGVLYRHKEVIQNIT